jgi:uncharacterized cupredoxin-like copper-binding protein
MIRMSRALFAAAIAASALAVAGASAAPAALAASSTAHSEAAAHWKLESIQAYEKQLAAGEVKAAKFNLKKHSLHLILKDGSRVRIIFVPHQQGKYEASLKAAGVKIPTTRAPSHKLRYIVGGIGIVLVIVIGVGIFLFVRRKRAEAEY